MAARQPRTPRSAVTKVNDPAGARGAQPGPGISELFSAGPIGGYRAPGPVALSFLQSDAFVCAIRGPLGSGKSTACALKLFSNVQKQQRLSDGWVRRRSAVIRHPADSQSQAAGYSPPNSETRNSGSEQIFR